MNLTQAQKEWLRGRPDPVDDDDLAEAFAAGWHAARPTIEAVSAGSVTHNSDPEPGQLKVSIWGKTEDDQRVRLELTEDAVRALRAGLVRCGF